MLLINMKTISDYIHTKLFDYPITKSIHNQTYEDFIEALNIDDNDIDDDLYKLYEEYNYKNVDGNGLRSYKGYQKYLYESLFGSYNSEDLLRELCKIYKDDIISADFMGLHSENIKSIIIKFKNDIIINDDKFKELLNFYNYYIVKTINNEYLIDPYKPQDFTNYVYNDCNGIIYHVTNKNTYNKIIKYGLKPKNLTKNNNKRPYRLFFLCLKDNKELMTQARQISSTSNGNIILKIDLNEYKNKLKFFKDTTAIGYDAYFTCEPIPPYCIKLYKEL